MKKGAWGFRMRVQLSKDSTVESLLPEQCDQARDLEWTELVQGKRG